MGCVDNGTDRIASPRPKASKPPKAKEGRVARTNPRPRAINRSARASEFVRFADLLRRDLDPRGPLERLLADHVIQSAWQLKGAIDRQAGRDLGDSLNPDVEGPKRRQGSTADRAGRSLRDALESLDFLRSWPAPTASIAPAFVPEIEPNEWPIVPTDGLDDFLEDPEPTEDEAPNWRDRLVFDFEVSDISPVVKGTWITVGHVVSLIVDGWTWADILRAHPELSEDDIRTCVAYAMAEENSAH